MYIFVYVPTTGRTASATAQNRVGPLPAHSSIVGGDVRAHGGPLQRRGASCANIFVKINIEKTEISL